MIPALESRPTVEPPRRLDEPVVAHDIKALTSVRLFAALWVAIFHLRPELEKLAPALRPALELFRHGYFAVPFFFILSGFILTHSYFPCYTIGSHWHFIVLRFARIWPVHGATLLVLLAYDAVLVWRTGAAVPGSPFPLAALPAEVGMVRCWFEKDLIWNYPAWSIHAEWFAYLFIFPLAFILFRSAHRRVLLGFAVAGLLIAHSYVPADRLPGKAFDIVLLFLGGVALYRLRLLLPATAGKFALFLGIGLLLCASWFGQEGGMLYTSFALIVLGLSYPSFLARGLSGRAWVYGGTISYSLYMTHALVQKFTAEILKRFPGIITHAPFIGLAWVLAAVPLAAVVTYHFVEAPCNQVLRRWARRTFPHTLVRA
jgi:peptidoglycan/LPS O-acetylase OafA/YrhL